MKNQKQTIEENVVIKYSESHGTTSLVIKKPSCRYLDEFFSLTCAPDILIANIFPNSKEITESFGAYNAVRKHRESFAFNDQQIDVICVGDGCQPRTAALFAFRSKWNCYSIDPRLNLTETNARVWNGIKRLHLIKDKIENFHHIASEKAIIVAVHSHAPLDVAVKNIVAKEKLVIAIPCCFEQNLDADPIEEYHDFGILSEKRLVKIWHIGGPK